MKRLMFMAIGTVLLLHTTELPAAVTCRNNSILGKIAGINHNVRGRGIGFTRKGNERTGWFQLHNGDVFKLVVSDTVKRDLISGTVTPRLSIKTVYEQRRGASLGDNGMYHPNYKPVAVKPELKLTTSKKINQFEREEIYTREAGRSTYLDAPPGAWNDNYLFEAVLKYRSGAKKPTEAVLNIYTVDPETNVKRLGVTITGEHVLGEVLDSFELMK